MNYIFVKTFLDLKRKRLFILTNFIIFICLICINVHINKGSDLSYYDIFYGVTIDNDILLIILKIYKVLLITYIIYYLIYYDLTYSKDNLFSRMTMKKWFIYKTISILCLIILYTFILFILSIGIKFIFNIEEACNIILFLKDFLFIITLSLLTMFFSINNNISKYIYIILLVLFIISFFIKQYNFILLYFIICIILYFFNLILMNISKKAI